ncbi:MAG: HNH endonuclease, partial [Nocardioides sp.]
PDTMTWLGALLPVTQGVAVFAALKAAADTARSSGDPRSRGQVMADTLVERVTGTSVTDPVRVNLDLVMTDRTFFHTSDESAHVPGYGPVPAEWAHDLLADALDAVQVWVRRLYTHPDTGQLVAMDSRARHAPAGLTDLVRRRDHDLCRTPWCGAPIRTTDHVTEWQAGGDTTESNTQGLCERCNLAKQAPGWTARPSFATQLGIGRHTVVTTTPTGHTYRSRAPSPLGHLDYNSRTTLAYDLIA